MVHFIWNIFWFSNLENVVCSSGGCSVSQWVEHCCQLKYPGFESHVLLCRTLGKFYSTLLQFTEVYWRGTGYRQAVVLTQISVAWLNASQRSLDGIQINRTAKRVTCFERTKELDTALYENLFYFMKHLLPWKMWRWIFSFKFFSVKCIRYLLSVAELYCFIKCLTITFLQIM